MAGIRQTNFGAGEFDPRLWGRTDLKTYTAGSRELTNIFPSPAGGLLSRPGTEYINRTKNDGSVRLIPFNYADIADQNYILEFGDQYVRFHTSQGTVAPDGANYLVWLVGTTYAAGAEIRYLTDGLVYRSLQAGNVGNTPSSSPTFWELVTIYEVATPYLAADLSKLKYVQVGDVITIVHGNYAPRELRRSGHANWSLVEVVLSPPRISTWNAAVAYSVGDIVYHIDLANGEGHYRNIQAGTHATVPPSATTRWKKYETLMPPRPPFPTLATDGADSSHPVKEWAWCMSAVYPDGTESVPSQPNFAVGPISAVQYQAFGVRLFPDSKPAVFRFGAVAGAIRYKIYRGRNGVFGYIDVSAKFSRNMGTDKYDEYTFADDGKYEPDFTDSPRYPTTKFKSENWRGFTRYNVGDRVINGSNTYECIRSGVSGATGGPTGTASTLITDGTLDIWTSGHNYSVGDVVNSFGSSFVCVSAHTSAGSPYFGPYGTGDEGFQTGWINAGSVRWYYLGEGAAIGWLYRGTAAAEPLRYPTTVAIFEQRRVFGGSNETPESFSASRIDSYGDFSTNIVITAKDSVLFELASRRREQIRSMVSLRHLMTMTNSSEWTVEGAANGDPMSPFSIRARVHSEHGSSWLDPLVIGNTLLHVQAKGTVVRDLYFDVNIDSYTGNELSILSKHFFRNHDIVSWAWAEDPYSVVWAVREDGALLSLTYARDQELYAWAQHETDGEYEQVCSIPEGSEDAVYFVINRGGARCIERAATREIPGVADAHCVDCGVFYEGAEVSSVTTPAVLDGRTDLVGLVDGNVVEGLAASAGSVTLPFPGSKIHVGIPYVCTWEALDVQSDREKQKIVREALVDVEASRGFFIGESTEDLSTWVEYQPRTLAGSFGALPLSTYTARVTITGKWGLGGRVALQQRVPLPITIVAVQRELVGGGA